MTVAVKVENMSMRIYVDCQRKIFCKTVVPLSKMTHYPIHGSTEVLNALHDSLLDQGYQRASRQAFESLCK